MSIPRREVRAMLASGRITVDGSRAQDISQVIGQFTHITLDDQTLQANTPEYIMLNKPAGVVSATRDEQHRTVIDVLGNNDYKKLHIAGRLDFNSTGLLLLTNDGTWSRQLSSPENSVIKQYRVTLEKPLTTDYVEAFAAGMYFDYEGITTRPATLKIVSDYVAVVGLTEGRYHQIKRMFGRFQNPVLTLHRFAIGNMVLDPSLTPGQSRDLTSIEIDSIA
ncbi:MAG: 16S rRNA pseudouridine516 synthase [Halioglobus sp.]|jgi:16S rRNA pseudouridine516 synthase